MVGRMNGLRGFHVMALDTKQAALCIKKVLRASPGFFAFLLSSSPVIICSTLLLGILLSYGEANLPEIGEDHRGTLEISDFKVGNSSSGIHFEANQRLSVPEIRGNTESLKETENEQTVLVRERASEHVDLDDDVPLLRRVDEEDGRYDRRKIPRALTPFPSMVSLRQEGGAGEELNLNKERELGGSFLIQDKAYNQTSLFDGALLSGRDSNDTIFGSFLSSETVNKNGEMEKNLNQERIFLNSAVKEVSEEKQSEGLTGTSKPTCHVSAQLWNEKGELNIDTRNAVEDSLLDSSLGSPWARISSQDGSSGFDSDGAESSSPDASMTDIAPVLDEIDPLLGSNSSRPEPIPKDESDSDSHVSEDNQIDDDSNDEGDEDDAKDNVEGKKKDDGKGAAFLWTADDEKNLMDLGYSEMERNRRLELLMARRRSRKNIRFEVDSNLIDINNNDTGRSLDDLSHFRAHVPPISVPRRNPFDLPYDSEEAIPGSAPSILHARKNPFDLPLEQSNDSGNDAHDSSNCEESVMSSHRDMFFRRHGSFNFGRTDATQERRFSRLKPYFVPETVEWSASNLQRQFSDKSESKLSSVSESDVGSSVADQEAHKDHDEKGSHMEHGSPSLRRQDSDLTDVGSECSDGINSVDVELDNSDIDDREIALQHFVFERSQEREAYLASTKGKDPEEDYTLSSAGNSTMSFHPVPDLLSWEDGDGDNSLGAKPSFESNTEVDCSEWVSSSMSVEESESGSGELPSYLGTEVASSSNTIILGASNPSEKDRSIDFMSYPKHEMPLDMELPSEFINETLPVISRDLHPIPEERVVENFSLQEKHETAIFTDPAAAVTGLHVIEEHFDDGSNGSLSSAAIAPYLQANDDIQSTSSGPAEISNPFVPMAAQPNLVVVDDMKEETAAEYLLDSDDEAGKVYPEPMEDSGIDESFLSELDSVGDFRVEPMGLDQHANGNGVTADPVISPQTFDNLSLSLTMSDSLGSREQSPSVDHINDPEFSWSFEVSHDPEQTVYNPRRQILEGSPFEAVDTELKPPQSERETPSSDKAPTGILGADSNDTEVMRNESMTSATDPEITVLDAKSLEDIENAFKLVSDGVVAEVSTNTETSHIVGADVDSEPKEVSGQLHAIDAKSVDDIHGALKEHSEPVVNSPLEENENKGDYKDTAECTKHDTPEPVQAESQLNVGDGNEAAQHVESTSNTSSSEAKTHGDFDAVSKELEADSANSTVQAMEPQGKEESEQQ
ncbi:hypothetical protein PR202_gb04451 [Eleusine coracana subsp. coracana]|uniref:Ulp1 protease family C-terminal catalytic domain containing protein expressed n=1 Tax=Eleusine coracana subsp. coracana TaxID=191504 RepID=A0AAV5E4N4_ELECO|nr:hypothetical protein PR202_gb04451 [Eleusine coracana subsp. coracana]